MLADYGLSGVLLCYGPLALVIVGFIGFAIVTDRNARSGYLRRLDPRDDEERGEVEPVVVTKEMYAVTPGGMMVGFQPDPAPAPAAPAAPVAEPVPVAAAPTEPDDLKKLEGIGPKVESVLKAAGISTFAQVAGMSASELRRILDDAGVTRVVNPESWPEQAGLAARGDWEALQALQDDLTAGRAG